MSFDCRFTKRIESEGESPIGDLERRRAQPKESGVHLLCHYAYGDALHCIGASRRGMRNCKEDRQPAAQVFYPPRAPPVFLACAGGAPRRSKKIRLVQ